MTLLKHKMRLNLFSLRTFTKRKSPVNVEKVDNLPVHDFSPTGDSSTLRVYGWGNGEHGGLGNQVTIRGRQNPPRYLHHPSRLHFAEKQKVIDVACGYGFSAFAVDSREHQLFGTGVNTDLQIGYHAVRHGHPLEVLLAPVPVGQFPPYKKGAQISDQVVAVSAGRCHLLVLMASGAVFTLGSNHFGQCGHSERHVKKENTIHVPHCISKAPDGNKFISIECGHDHSLFLSEKGEVWGCGWGADGQMGQGNSLSSWQLQHITGDLMGERIVKLSSSADSVLALSGGGDLFGWGNNEYGQLLTSCSGPQQCVPRHIKLPSTVGTVKDIAAGGSFCLIVNDYGEVFVWGYGILGLGPVADHSREPQLIPSTLFGEGTFQDDATVVKLAAGLSYSMAVLSNGHLYSWGHNTNGCLGLGHLRDQYFPMKVAVGAQVIKVSCGTDHLLALCKPFA